MQANLLTKSYDLRGVYGSDLTASDYFFLARAFIKEFTPKKVAVGMDARISSPECAKACIAGITSMGVIAVDLGICSSDMLQFSSMKSDIDLALMITASHNPKEYNGLKSCLRDAKPINLKEYGSRLSNYMENDITSYNTDIPADLYEKRDISDAWIEHVASFVPGIRFDNLTVVADAGNGTAGAFMEKLAKKLGFTLIPLFFDPDGNFPNHHPSPIESKNTIDMVHKVRETGADIGVAFDGDADRAVLCDETGALISASTLCVAIAEGMLARNSGATIAGNAVLSKSVKEKTEALGGTYLKTLVGHVYLKEHMAKDHSIVFGGEHSGHYYFQDNANADSGVIAFVHFLEAMHRHKVTASALKKRFDLYEAIEETNFKVENPKEAIERISLAFNQYPQERFDGLTVELENGWFNLRPSSNEPLLRLNMESNSKEGLVQLQEKVLPHLA